MKDICSLQQENDKGINKTQHNKKGKDEQSENVFESRLNAVMRIKVDLS